VLGCMKALMRPWRIAELTVIKSRSVRPVRRKLADAAQNNNTDAVRLMLAAGWPVVRDHVFHVPLFGHELQNVLARGFSEFCAQVNVVPEIIDSRDQAFQNERGFIAGHYELTGVIRQTTALKKRKRHFGRAYKGECVDCTPAVRLPLRYYWHHQDELKSCP